MIWSNAAVQETPSAFINKSLYSSSRLLKESKKTWLQRDTHNPHKGKASFTCVPTSTRCLWAGVQWGTPSLLLLPAGSGDCRKGVKSRNSCTVNALHLTPCVLKLLKLWTLNPAIKLWIQAQPIRPPVTAPSTTPNHVHKLCFEPRHTEVVCCKQKVHQFQARRRGKDQAPSRLQKKLPALSLKPGVREKTMWSPSAMNDSIALTDLDFWVCCTCKQPGGQMRTCYSSMCKFHYLWDREHLLSFDEFF